MAATCAFQVLHRKAGHITSGALFAFWTLLIAVTVPTMLSSCRDLSEGVDAARFESSVNVAAFVLTAVNLVLTCFSDFPSDGYCDKKCNLEEQASALSLLVHAWLDRLIWAGFRKKSGVEKSDVPDLKSDLTAERIAEKYQAALPSKTKKSNINVFTTLLRAFGLQFFVAVLLKILQDVLKFVSPQILKQLIRFVQQEQNEEDEVIKFVRTSFETT